MVADGAWRCVVVTDGLRRFMEVADSAWRCVVVSDGCRWSLKVFGGG